MIILLMFYYYFDILLNRFKHAIIVVKFIDDFLRFGYFLQYKQVSCKTALNQTVLELGYDRAPKLHFGVTSFKNFRSM